MADTHLVVMVMTVILQLGVPVVEVAHLLHLVVAVGVAELETNGGMPGSNADGYGAGGGGGGGKYGNNSGIASGGSGGNGSPGFVIIEWWRGGTNGKCLRNS
ncbi:Uncharacterised protein [Kluyvera cryocrescens]|uniref:Uncharacterized protein n=1 Tax=Kluyvera cryocrescens TaxID=580 RepID=A0A485D3S3_KLUCR|nr:Uncharacterised protein [Kluyvera cryocrescens]